MSEPSETTNVETVNSKSSGRCRRRGKRFHLLGLLALLACGIFAGQAIAQGFGHGHRGHFGGEIDVDRARTHAGIAVGVVLEELDATESQSDAIEGIMDSAIPEMIRFHDEMEALREGMHAALMAEDVDIEELEISRVQLLDIADRATRRGLEVLVEASNVLTLEQRLQLMEFHQ